MTGITTESLSLKAEVAALKLKLANIDRIVEYHGVASLTARVRAAMR